MILTSLTTLSLICIKISFAFPIHETAEDRALKTVSALDIDYGVNFLMKYGYLFPQKQHAREDNELQEATKTFQRFYGLKDTGTLDAETLILMKKPRCGMSDTVDFSTISKDHAAADQPPYSKNKTLSKALIKSKVTGNRKKRYVLMSRWPSTKITYGFISYTNDMTITQQQDAIARALEVWSYNTPLTFTQLWQTDVNITISFERGYHGDGYPFDGRGRTLAHAFFPGQGKRSGDVHFDSDENWIYKSEEEGTNLFLVAMHEFGHALGLGHSSNKNSVMLPFYYKRNFGMKLSEEDVIAIHRLYAEKTHEGIVASDNQISFGSPTRISTSDEYENSNVGDDLNTKPSDVCNYEFDAVANIRGEMYFFKGNYFWRIVGNGRRYNRIKMSKFWINFPRVKVDAVYAPGTKIIIFSGNRYWSYTNIHMDEGSPGSISDFNLPTDGGIDAAMIWPETKGTYFFKGSRFWKYDETRKRIVKGYPKDINTIQRVPQNMSGAFHDPKDNEIYFFKGKKFWRLNKHLMAANDSAQYIGVKWFGCKPEQYIEEDSEVIAAKPAKTGNRTTRLKQKRCKSEAICSEAAQRSGTDDTTVTTRGSGGGGGSSRLFIHIKLQIFGVLLTLLLFNGL